MRPGRDALISALEAHAVAVVQMAPGHWTFVPAAAPWLRATVRHADDWLLFEVPLPEPAGVSAWDVFAANAWLHGNLKWCTGAYDPALRLRAELPLTEQPPVAHVVQEVCASVAAAAAWLRSGAHLPQSDGTVSNSAAGTYLQQLCAETAWPFTPRGDDVVMVELDVPGTFQQAAVELQPDRGVVVSVPVLPEPPGDPVCAAAVGAFLLRLTGAVRMARAAIRTSDASLCFEVVRPTTVAPAELAEAFSALSLAWRCGGREVAVLAGDEYVAQLYLDHVPPRIAGTGVSDLTTNNEQPTT